MLNIGDRVRALVEVREEGPEENPSPPSSVPCTRGWVHAKKDSLGVVVHVEEGVHPTIRWDDTKTSTIAMEGVEFELLPQSGRLDLNQRSPASDAGALARLSHAPDEELFGVIKRFLNYSFTDISFRYEELTPAERQFCSWEQFQRLVEWVKKDAVPGEGIEPTKAAL
jgi:hypothetical protein